MAWPFFQDADVVARRGERAAVDPWRANAAFIEPELSSRGVLEDTAVLLLTNRECPFHCVFCDLWKQTTEVTVPLGAIPAQIDLALLSLPSATQIKLYNSGNFFDRKAIPIADHPAIAQCVRGFKTVIVENHPLLCGDDCLRFRDLLPSDVELEVALGLETIHPQVLPRLNKRMTTDDFARAAEFLTRAGIFVRSFVLLQPPFLTIDEAVEWAVRSVEFARDHGSRVVSIIPTRSDDGLLIELESQGLFHRPPLKSLEQVLAQTLTSSPLQKRADRVFVDLWDAQKFAQCTTCVESRVERLRRINHSQQIEPEVHCACTAPL